MVESTSSCGSISCPSTESSPAPDPPRRAFAGTRPADPASPCDGAALLRELDRMRTLLAARASSRGGFSLRKGERLLVVARFAPGLTLEAWDALTRGTLPEPPSAGVAEPSTSAQLVPEQAAPEQTLAQGAAGLADGLADDLVDGLPDSLADGLADSLADGLPDDLADGLAGQGPWFVLDLDPAQHPQLLALCQDSSHLFHAVCPLTGALLPEPFRAHLDTALHRLTEGGELSLILLELVTPVWMKAACAHNSEIRTHNGDACTHTSGETRAHNGEARAHNGDACAYAHGDAEQREGAGAPFSPSALDFPMSSLARVARSHIRVCDTPGRLAVDRLALVLPGTGPFRARALAERLIGDFCEAIAAEYGRRPQSLPATDAAGMPENPADQRDLPVQVRAGIACCDAEQGLGAEALLGQASTALTLARPGHTRTFRKTGSPERKTQVQACEKQFLFFGDPE